MNIPQDEETHPDYKTYSELFGNIDRWNQYGIFAAAGRLCKKLENNNAELIDALRECLTDRRSLAFHDHMIAVDRLAAINKLVNNALKKVTQ